jgi:hypothetical protein
MGETLNGCWFDRQCLSQITILEFGRYSSMDDPICQLILRDGFVLPLFWAKRVFVGAM